MGTKIRLARRVPKKATITRFLLRSGAAKVALVDGPVLLARGALAIPNKSGLARLALKRKAARRAAWRALALGLSAAAAGAAAGYLVKEGAKPMPAPSLFDASL